MTKDQGGGIIERAIYGVILFLVLKFGARFGLSNDDAAWVAGGGVTLAGGVWAWLHNRPASVLTRGSDSLPAGAALVITTAPGASPAVKEEARALADSAGPKVVSKTT